MAVVKIFWQDSCPNCPPAKSLGKKLQGEGVQVEYHDVKDVNGLSEAAFFDIMGTPSVVVAEGAREIAAWRNGAPSYDEVKKFL